MTFLHRTIVVISLLLPVLACRHASGQVPVTPTEGIRNSVGMQLRVADEHTYPTLRIVLPGHPTSDRAIEVIFPEHVTVRPRGRTDANQLVLFQPGQSGERPLWRRSGRSLEYERNLPGAVHMVARATLEEDGLLRIISSQSYSHLSGGASETSSASTNRSFRTEPWKSRSDKKS